MVLDLVKMQETEMRRQIGNELYDALEKKSDGEGWEKLFEVEVFRNDIAVLFLNLSFLS